MNNIPDSAYFNPLVVDAFRSSATHGMEAYRVVLNDYLSPLISRTQMKRLIATLEATLQASD